MTEQGSLLDDLKARGTRITPQRAIIIEAIETLSGHITAEQIFAAVQQVNAYISLATVYRTLDLLKELGLIIESNMGGPTSHYALHDHSTHHHAVCRMCRHTIELPSDLFKPIADQLQTRYGFMADDNHLVVFGWCKGCAERAFSGGSTCQSA